MRVFVTGATGFIGFAIASELIAAGHEVLGLIRIHKTLRTTPAMATGVTKRLWEIGDIVDVLEAWEASPKI